MPNSAYPICYHDIAKSQETDAKLNQKLVSNKDYTLDTFRGGDKEHCLICRNNKICLPKALQNKTVDWYHEMLCHPGETQTEHTLRQHFDWRGLRTTVHEVCKKCPTCQRAKTTNHKYGKLPPNQAETNPWDTLCVYLIGPYTIPRKCLPKTLQNKTVDWYHEMLYHPGETQTEHNLRQHFDWRGLVITVHDVCKKCPTCQRANAKSEIWQTAT